MRRWCSVLGAVVACAAATFVYAQNSVPASDTQDANQRKILEFDKPKPLTMTRDLADGGTLVLDVNVGDVRVARNPGGNAIRLEVQPQHFDSEKDMRGWVREFEVAGNRATVRMHMPKQHNNGVQVVIYVPVSTSLKVDLGVGDLRISHIRGDKTLHVGIGDLVVGIEDAGEYGHLENAVKLGDVHDQVYHVERDGFFGQEKHLGNGMYHLRANVGIGDLTIEPEEKM